MFTHHNYSIVSIFAILLVLNCSWCCFSLGGSFNESESNGFSPAVATWYGDPYGAGSDGGGCGYMNKVSDFPYYGMIAAGNNNLFKSGKGCGTCYQIKCTQNSACSGRPITITITDECPGSCNNEAIHFDLGGKAFGYLAKDGMADQLRNAGRINVEYQRVRCYYNKAFITFRVDLGSNPYYLAFTVENVNGDGDLGQVQILPSNKGATWLNMQQSWGATWKVDLPQGTYGPFSVKITNIRASSSVIASNVIPADWAPGKYYESKISFRPSDTVINYPTIGFDVPPKSPPVAVNPPQRGCEKAERCRGGPGSPGRAGI